MITETERYVPDATRFDGEVELQCFRGEWDGRKYKFRAHEVSMYGLVLVWDTKGTYCHTYQIAKRFKNRPNGIRCLVHVP